MTTQTAQPDTLLLAAQRLADALARENAALLARDVAGAEALFQEKQRAADGFAAAQSAVRAPLPPAQRAALRPVALRLGALGQQNRALLERAIVVQQRVLGIIARAARTPPVAAGYGARGQAAAPPSGAAILLRSA